MSQPHPLAVCAHCGHFYNKHFVERGIVYCNDYTNGDTWSEEPDNESIGALLESHDPALYATYVEQWKRENGHLPPAPDRKA